ncbi:MAG: YGL010W-like membrane protein [Alteromonadaceae bacterium]|jgi:uncharacterized membrane protein YGL010W
MKKSIDAWLAEYGQSHTNKINKLIHWVAVPVIYITVFGLLWDIPKPSVFSVDWVNWATVLALPVMIFYFALSFTIGLAMSLFSLAVVVLLYWFNQQQIVPLAVASAVIFAVMWVFQFIGHHIEGKKPSFFKDIQFLLIGPVWIMADILRRLKIAY